VRYGLCPGSSDIIGYKAEDVCLPNGDAFVPTRLASFVAIEVKDAKWREPRHPGPRGSKSAWEKYLAWEAQRDFLAQVREAGGLAGVARSVEDVLRILGIDAGGGVKA
jgi:hypothetical protein